MLPTVGLFRQLPWKWVLTSRGSSAAVDQGYYPLLVQPLTTLLAGMRLLYG